MSISQTKAARFDTDRFASRFSGCYDSVTSVPNALLTTINDDPLAVHRD